MKKCFEFLLFLICMVEGIVEWRYLSFLCWKKGDIVRNKSYYISVSWLVLFVDFFIFLYLFGEIFVFFGDRERWEEKIKVNFLRIFIYFFIWRLNLIYESGFFSLFYLFWSFIYIKDLFEFFWEYDMDFILFKVIFGKELLVVFCFVVLSIIVR